MIKQTIEFNIKRLLIFYFCFFGCGKLSAQPNKPLALKQITIVDVETGSLILNQTVVVYQEIIIKVGPSESVSIPKNSIVINGRGKYLIPGLWDSHVHLSYIGASTLPVLVAYGITGVRDLGSIVPEVNEWQERIRKGSLVGPRIKVAGYNIESSEWLDAANQIINSSELLKAYHLFTIAPRLRVSNAEDARKAVDSLINMGSDVVKFRNLGRESFFALAKAARQKGILLVGHSPKGVSLAEASDVGIASIEHGETIANSLSQLDSLERASQLKRLIQNGTMLTPTLIADYRAKLSSSKAMYAAIVDSSGSKDYRNKFISPPLRKMWQLAYDTKNLDSSTDWKSLLNASDLKLKQAYQLGVQMLAGTDLGVILVYPGSGLHEELIMMVENLGMSPAQALKTATLNPAKFFNMDNKLGTIKVQNHADMVVLNSNPLIDIHNTQQINAVILNGKYMNRKSLDRLLAKAIADIKKDK